MSGWCSCLAGAYAGRRRDLPVCLSACLPVCLSACLSACLIILACQQTAMYPRTVLMVGLSCFERASVRCQLDAAIYDFTSTSATYFCSPCLREGAPVVPTWSRVGSLTGSSGKHLAIMLLIKARPMNHASTGPSCDLPRPSIPNYGLPLRSTASTSPQMEIML